MNNKGSEALFQASSTCKLRLVRMLVEGGTSVNVRNERLETPLMLCCQSKTEIDEKSRVVSYLISKQAKVNLQDIDGRTALIYACISNCGKEIIQELLDAKSNPWIEDESKNTVFDYVINAEDLDTTRLLINACRESMLVDARDNIQMKHLEECLTNIQDMRKFSWPLMGPRLRRNHSHLYAAEKEDPSISGNNLLGADLGGDGETAPPAERRRKRSVCHFDPLDIQEILNCTEEAGTSTTNTENEQDDQSESEETRKTSVRSLSEEERFSVQISDADNVPRDPSSGLEKLLKLQDSFTSSFDFNEFPCTISDSHRNSLDTTRSSSVEQQFWEEKNSTKERKRSVPSSNEVENTNEGGARREESKLENRVIFSFDERREAVNAVNKDEKLIEETSKRERLFTIRVSSAAVSKRESCTSLAETPRHVILNSVMDKAFVENIENRSNRIISPVTSQHSSPVMSPLASPRVTRRQTHTSVTLKQCMSPRVSPVPTSESNRREVNIVRRYTLSAMDMGKFQNTGVIKTLLAPPATETDAGRGSAVLESTTRGGPEGNFTPPGLRKSKSDMTDWRSMSRNLQGKDLIETAPKQGPSIQGFQQFTDHGKEGSHDVSEFQLPSISSMKKGRRSSKDFTQPMPVMISPTVESKAFTAEPRLELALPWRNNVDKQRLYLSGQEFPLDDKKRSPSPSRVSLPSSPKDLPISSPNSSCDVIAIAKVADLSPRGPDNTPGDVLPDLLFNSSASKFQYTDESGPKQGGTSVATPQASSHSQQRGSPRLRLGTLLPPLTISNRRSPTHELEDGYFSGTPSPADVESPRRKLSNEQLRYSFRPISPRSPIRSPKLFNLQSGKPPPSR
ncbi:Ankyrin repeat [Desmophyllum pertusum]|uniref:Ankyrin repeat n=1 Tax=Desmophyllum pertusum TaxID=174260 RepID=A0A9X0A6K7_9CNID|nr:Ankyrin repeat [Desmophyllum pertusum]